MKRKQEYQNKWMDGIGEIADSYVLEAVNYSKQKRMSGEYLKVAAIIFLCICASMSILLYRGNLSMEDNQKTVSVGDGQKADSVGDGQKMDSAKEEGSASKQTGKYTGSLTTFVYGWAAEIGQEEDEQELEEEVETGFSRYSPEMSNLPAIPFYFKHSGDEEKIDIKVSASLGVLQKYKVEKGIWNVSEEDQVLHCKCGEKIYWDPLQIYQDPEESVKNNLPLKGKECILTVEVFFDNVLREQKEITIGWNDNYFSNYILFLTSNKKIDTSQEAETAVSKSDDKKDSVAKKLPVYQYTGKDEIKKAIYNYVAADENGEFDSDLAGNDSDVLIPHLMKTYGRFDEGDHVVFFGHLCRMYYTKSGDILKSTGGESLTFKAVLQKEEEEYSVKEFEVAKSGGSRLWDSVKKMMKGYPEAEQALEKSLEGDDDVEEKERKRVIRQYVKDNDLKIRYYKDYGWDKVKLSD